MRTQLQQDCLNKAQQIADEINGDLFYVPDEDVDQLLSQLNEDNINQIANELAELAYQFNWLQNVHYPLLYALSTTMENAIILYIRWSTKDDWVLQIVWKSCWTH